MSFFLTRRNVFLISMATLLALGAPAAKKKVKYPRVQSVVGSAIQVSESVVVKNRSAEALVKEKTLRSGIIFKDHASMRTMIESQLRIDLGPDQVLIVFPLSEVDFPAIHWQKGYVEEILLRSGSLRLICKTPCETRVTTAVSSTSINRGDFIFSYDPKMPKVSLEVVQGEIEFKGLENEVSIPLKTGEKAEFQGEFDSGAVAYDVLLRGRKVAKGQLSPKAEISKSRLAQLLLDEEKFKRKQAQKIKAKSRARDQICDEPWGRLNECSYQCLGNPKKEKVCNLENGAQCLRRRCNANGQWADPQFLGQAEASCSVKDIVKPCDY
jgi:hypothetical protein